MTNKTQSTMQIKQDQVKTNTVVVKSRRKSKTLMVVSTVMVLEGIAQNNAVKRGIISFSLILGVM